MEKLFRVIPSGFFNCLASGSNNEIYSDCLQIIYEQYDREITYRIARSRIRDALSIYLLENHVDSLDMETPSPLRFGATEEPKESGSGKNYNELANAIIRKFCSREIGWLQEDNDDATYEKHIIMTENGIRLAEFLEQLRRPEREEFSGYIFNIVNVLKNEDQWSQDPYVGCLKNIYRNAKLLSKALKRLSTFVKTIIERMLHEVSLESLTENIIEYCDGSFIREYARLTKQQNIHLYRRFICSSLENMTKDENLYELLVVGCAVEEDLTEEDAREQVLEMIERTKGFLSDDYDRIMRDIKHKINVYLQIAVGRARFLQNRGADARGAVERTMKYIVEEMRELDWGAGLPEDMNALFWLERNEFIDRGSLRYPRKTQSIRKETSANLETMSQEDLDEARRIHEREAWNPYSRDRMKEYFDAAMGDEIRISSDRLPMESRRDLLCALSATAYGEENGFEIRPEEGYIETNGLILRRFEIVSQGSTS